MKQEMMILTGMGLMMLPALSGCTRMEMEPSSGPPGTTVYVKAYNMFGDPAQQTLKWDGDVLCNPFPGSFVVPLTGEGGEPGKHRVMLVDNLDASEAMLFFPLFRGRHSWETFTVEQ